MSHLLNTDQDMRDAEARWAEARWAEADRRESMKRFQVVPVVYVFPKVTLPEHPECTDINFESFFEQQRLEKESRFN